MPQSAQQTLEVDIAIIGGGIAGLWLINRLTTAGYNAVLFEQTALGSDQTIASQGMIHGGIKYTLSGTLSGASEAIADMPDHWRACLKGQGDVDLRGVEVLSDHFYMWSSGKAVSKVSTFLASKATRGRVKKVGKKDRPEIFKHSAFTGSLYKLVDIVLDVPAVIKKLASNCAERIFQINWQTAAWGKTDAGAAYIDFDNKGEPVRLHAQQFILTAGRGNEELLTALGAESPRTQRRPLQQVVVKHEYPHQFYGHCLGAETTPRLTISSHPYKDENGTQQQVWYLGGSMAEKGASLPPEDVIAHAKRELRELLPWVDLTRAEWATVPVDRAEPRQRNFARPDEAFAGKIDSCSNVIVAWPTKLTLSPNLADQVLSVLHQENIEASNTPIPNLNFLPSPPLAVTPWQQAFDNTNKVNTRAP